MTKKYDEIGSPCLRPLSSFKGEGSLPLSRMALVAEQRHNLIKPIILSEIPNILSTLKRKLHSFLSYILLVSILMPTKPFLALFFLILSITSRTKIEFYAIHLPRTNADWNGDIILSRNPLSLRFRRRSFVTSSANSKSSWVFQTSFSADRRRIGCEIAGDGGK